ncbi:Hsp70 protein [Actinocorallia herbida]|uniref:Hsp70 protein n=1 Tax=Actinocorallia herbida TaxID=58109 RepID=A0A3N1CY58_9ACTN|nr:Hsp70 family protein [Actinocorallia herbida]ROO86237.1 Hsp70 protein [Actinocorallia herbida]
MTAAPDPRRTWAVLIGTGEYDHAGPSLPRIPAAAGNLADLRAALCSPLILGVPREQCLVVENPSTPDDLLNPVREAAGQDADLLLVYYTGHGLVSRHRLGELYLALRGTDPEVVAGGVEFKHVGAEVAGAGAASRILMLDCCFSAKATLDLVGATSRLFSKTGDLAIIGASERAARAPKGARNTAFTGTLLEVVREGVDDPSPYLTLSQTITLTGERLAASGQPKPAPFVWGSTWMLPFVRNRGHRSVPVPAAPAAAGAAHRRRDFTPPVRGPVVGMDLSSAVPVAAVLGRKGPQRIHRAAGPAPSAPDRPLAEILAGVRKDASAHLGQFASDAVIAVPARWAAAEVDAVCDAAEAAGWNVLAAPGVSVCAFVAHHLHTRAGTTALVLHLGARHCEVSLVGSGFGSEVAVHADHHDPELGGDRWTACVVAWIITSLEDSGLSGIRERFGDGLEAVAEDAMAVLCEGESAVLRPAPADGGEPVALELGRGEFEEATKELRDRLAGLVRRVVAEKGEFDIDEVVLSGAGARMPAIRDLVEAATGIRDRGGLAPELVVAFGACAYPAGPEK